MAACRLLPSTKTGKMVTATGRLAMDALRGSPELFHSLAWSPLSDTRQQVFGAVQVLQLASTALALGRMGANPGRRLIGMARLPVFVSPGPAAGDGRPFPLVPLAARATRTSARAGLQEAVLTVFQQPRSNEHVYPYTS